LDSNDKIRSLALSRKPMEPAMKLNAHLYVTLLLVVVILCNGGTALAESKKNKHYSPAKVIKTESSETLTP
jgi:hypothetical protein